MLARVRRSSKILLCFVSLVGILETNLVILAAIEVQKEQKTSFLASEKPANHTSEGKGHEKWEEQGEKKEDEQKCRGCNLGFFVDSICAQKLLDGRGLFKKSS